MPLLMCWSLWIARNQSIFNLKNPHWPAIMIRTTTVFDLLPEKDSNSLPQIIKREVIDKTIPWAYFDGSTQEAGCGGGAILYLNETHCIKIQMRLGRGTNNYAELCTAKHLIHFALEKHCKHLQLHS